MVLKQEYYNLYQTQIWKDIQSKVYQKDTFSIRLFGKEYFGLIKKKKIGPISLQRYQIMGILLPSDPDYIRSELQRIKKEYSKSRGNISFQLGCINEIISFENCGMRESEFVKDIKQMRLSLRKKIQEEYPLKLAFRENMPQSNIIYSMTKTDEELIAEMNSGAKEKVRKGMKKKVEFKIANPEQYETFYEKWTKVGSDKGFNPVTKKQFYSLMDFLKETGKGEIFITELNGEIVSGNICLLDDGHLVYLYGFAERGNNNTGGQHYLKFKVFQRAREHGYLYCDMLGGAPTGFDDHPLIGVSKFKESLGGTKIELYGNFDLILNTFLYKVFNRYTKLREKH